MVAAMTFSEQVRHPAAALDPPKESGGLSLWWLVICGGVAALILIAIFRPAWLAKIGIQVNLSSAAAAVGAVSNPMGWV